MKNISLIFFLLISFFICSCTQQEIKVNYKNILINISGKPGPWLKKNGKYYCYFETIDSLSIPGEKHFYILDKKGKIEAQINVPKELQTFYFDLYLKNDTIFTTEYYDQETFFLDEVKKRWQKTKKGIDLYYEDDAYIIYALDFGEWGAATWFKEKKSNEQFEISATTPIINKFNNSYYLTEESAILKIDDPKKMDLSKKPYDYKKVVLDKDYFREGNFSINGAEILFSKKDNEHLRPQQKFCFGTSFVLNNKLYHLYKDSLSTKIGTLVNNKLVPVYTFKSKITPFTYYYDTRNRIQNNKYQSVQFFTEKENVYGIIEINSKDINVTYFRNLQ